MTDYALQPSGLHLPVGFSTLSNWWRKFGWRSNLEGQFAPGQDIQMIDRGTQAPPAGAAAATRTYLSSESEAGSGTTKTRALNGGARTGKWIVSMSSHLSAGSGQAGPTSVTLNTVALTELVSVLGADGRSWTGIYYSATDITCDGTDSVVSEWAGGQNQNAAALYSVDNVLSFTPGDTATDTSGTAISVNTDVVADGLIFGIVFSYGSTGDLVWTGIGEDAELSSNINTRTTSWASDLKASASTPLTISATTANTNGCACTVALR